ncbi:glucose-6-phosphate dehydrogenase [Deinococcus aestuarii]|uniref:glucose-6-phosphate dehydrogenase n=1 Tax=Deinococcus aestuarii TaxID=2774531 RepID=UPI001C0CF38B|nr:glucose-6-phosphate dehydrogenase [Deinococcus aestuarii]
MIGRLLLFGATGDLAGRFLLPALAELHGAGKLPANIQVFGSATNDWNDETFRQRAAEQLEEHAARDVSAASREAVVRSLRYRRVEFNNTEQVAGIVEEASGGADGAEPQPVAAYLALPAAVFAPAVRALGRVGLPEGSRIVLEKPFGEDLESAQALNDLLRRVTGVAGEEAIFRVDHALGMATVQNLLAVRLANRVLEPLWNAAHIEQVDLLWEETLALEGRASYYDRAGALKDVIQNHLFQVLCLLAMEPPISLGERDLRDRKMDVLRSVRPLTGEDVLTRTRRARYTAGRLADTGGADGSEVPAYADEAGVDPARGTETYAQIVLEIDNWRWAGTRFVLCAGKALAGRRKEAVVRFRPVPHLPFDEAMPPGNELRIGLDGPYDLALRLTGRAAGPPSHLAPLTLDAQLPAPELPAYSRVLLDVLTGDGTLSIRGDEAEESWRVLTPVLRAWAENRVPLEAYPAGSPGPPPR